jgi:hypothetical protein
VYEIGGKNKIIIFNALRQKGFKMNKDRTEICRIISEMLDSQDKHGIYPTSTAFTRLEHYIEGVRAEAIGWMYANACVTLDRGDDPRTMEVPRILERAKVDLA